MALQNINANITLDIYNHDTTPSTVKAIQLDSQTRYVAAMLQNMGAQYDVDENATVQLTVIRPDKVGVQIAGTAFTYGDEGAQFLGPYAELTQVALAVNGKMRGQFKITSGAQILRTEIFTISNGEALDASTDEWAGEYDGYNLDELVEKVDAAVEKVDGMEDKLNISEIVFTNGAYIKTDGSTVDVNSPVTNSAYRYAVVPCKEGDWVEINVDGTGAARGYAFVDSNGNKIYSTASNVVTRGTIRVPPNTAYLVLNCKTSAEYIPSYKGLLNNYAVESLQVKNDADTASSNNQKYTPKSELCRISLSTATQVVAFLHNTTNRVSPVPDSFMFIKKGTRVYINDSTTTAQFFLLEKAMDGTMSAGQWVTEYIASNDVYAIPCLRYSDDSDITNADALAKLLTIDFGYRKDDIPMWRNEWFVDGSHRGYMEEAPQSTLAAFVRAKVHGYNTCECDLRKTSDGHFVVHHNASMPSDSSYYIYLHTLAELRANANMGTYNGITQQILEFKDLLQLMKQLDMKLFVELKSASGNEGSKFTAQDIADLVDTVKDLGMQDRVIWMGTKDSTDHAYAQRFRDADSDCYLAIIDSTTPSEVQPYVISGKPDRTLMYARTTYITESVVQNFANIGVSVMAWAVTFSWLYPDWTEEQIKAEIRRCISCGIVGMVLDKWTISELVREEYADYL